MDDTDPKSLVATLAGGIAGAILGARVGGTVGAIVGGGLGGAVGRAGAAYLPDLPTTDAPAQITDVATAPTAPTVTDYAGATTPTTTTTNPCGSYADFSAAYRASHPNAWGTEVATAYAAACRPATGRTVGPRRGVRG